MKSVSRRKVLGSIGLSAGAGLWLALGRDPGSATQAADKPAPVWSYTHLDPDAIADDAYRLFPDGGCMYGLFGAVVTGLASNAFGTMRCTTCHQLPKDHPDEK